MNPTLRAATASDVPRLLELIAHYAHMGELLPRAEEDVMHNLRHFVVAEHHGQVIACGSLEHFSEELAEIRSLMVVETAQGLGIGLQLATRLLDRARKSQTRRVMALTYVPDFFIKLGFKVVSKAIFPEKIWGICVNCYKFHNCDEIAVLLELN